MKVLSLAQALQENRKNDSSKPALVVNIISNTGLIQFRCFLQAYLARLGLPASILPEEYNGLISKMLNPQKEHFSAGAHLVVIDSFSIGAHPSVRSPGTFTYNDTTDFEHAIGNILHALDSFRGGISGPMFILPVLLSPLLFHPYPAGLMSDGQLRAMDAFAKIGGWAQKQNMTPMLSCIAPEQDEKKFFDSGELFSTPSASVIAYDVALALYGKTQGLLPRALGGEKRLLITDLDDTFWAGTIGESGIDELEYLETPRGRPHWLYQRYLDFLSREGVILAACSKNNPEIIDDALQKLPLPCGKNRFAMILANWNRKSENVKKICLSLNLLPEHVAMVDDNPMELEEIASAVPGITTVLFPRHIDDVIPFLYRLRSLFLRAHPVRDIDVRLSSYQSIAQQSERPSITSAQSPDYIDFLKSLEMTLSVDLLRPPVRERVFELINKTNQFNCTGIRLSKQEFDAVASVSDIWTFSLRDRHADHGLIGVVILPRGASRCLTQCVISCRVFSRFVEDAMAEFCMQQNTTDILLAKTRKNAPAISFFSRILAQPGLNDHISESPQKIPFTPRELFPFPGRIIKDTDKTSMPEVLISSSFS